MAIRSGQKLPGLGWVGHVDRVLGRTIEGWVKKVELDLPQRIDVLVDDKAIAVNLAADLHRSDVEEAGIGTGCFGFACHVPADINLAGARLEIRLHATQELLLARTVTDDLVHANSVEGTPIESLENLAPTIAPAMPEMECEGRIETLTEGLLRGWASDSRRRGRTFPIDVLLDGVFLTQIRNDQPRGDLRKRGKSEGLGGFQLDLFLDELEPGTHEVAVVLPDGTRIVKTVATEGNKRRYRLHSGRARFEASDTAIIVPIYNAADDLEVCIRRLVDYTPPQFEVLLIDDASPDPRINALLSDAEHLPGFRVLRNDSNLGFTRTVNRALDEIGQKHAILLNSDARVTPGWAQGMLRAATSRPKVATVTAMSDRAGAFSAPKIGNDNPLPAGVDEITYARAFRRWSLGLYPVVPTGNGFCMFVNRDCLNEIGALDAEAFPRGYGEENDFCMRAGRNGWSHVIDDRTYVFHDRSKSFKEAKNDLLLAGRSIVDQRYPEYKTAIQAFSTKPELAMARFRAAQAMRDCSHAKAGLPSILYVVATQTGGTPQTNMDLMSEISEEMAPWLLHCDSKQMTLSRLDHGKMIELRSHLLSEAVDPLTHRSDEYDSVVSDWLEIVNPRIVHIRHLAWHSLSLPALAKARGSKVVFSFHDFYTLCPTVKLLDENNVFCGGNCTATAGECSIELWKPSGMPKIKNSWVHVWRQRFADVLSECDAYVTTSESARTRILSQLSLDPERFFVIPHGRNFETMQQLRQHPQHGEPVRILVPGNISSAKGREIITALLAHDRAGILEFHILGKISQPQELKHHKRLVMHGPYQRDGFAQRVAQIKPHLGAVLSIWDETYCHTLTELWSVGLPAIVFDFPTVAGRVRSSGAGWVLPHDDIVALYDRLIALSFDGDEQIRADLALLGWQSGNGVGRSTKVMAGAYREVYRKAMGHWQARPVIAVVSSSSPRLDRANASTEIRIWERCINSSDRNCVFVRMSPQGLLANLRAGDVDGAILQRNVIPATMVTPLLTEFERSGIRYALDMDDNLFDVPAEKDPDGAYAAYAPSLEKLARSAAVLTSSTEALRRKLQPLNARTQLMPNRLSERIWRGDMPERVTDGMVRALYMGTKTHRSNFALIAPALDAVAAADPHFRVAIIGVQDEDLPPWAERIIVPDAEKSYARFVPWLKALSAQFDFGLAPLTDDPLNLYKSNLKALDYSALGLPVLASDMAVYRPLAGQLPGLQLVKSKPANWQRAVTALIAETRAGGVDRQSIRAAALAGHGIAATLSSFDEMVISLARVPESKQPNVEGEFVHGRPVTKKDVA